MSPVSRRGFTLIEILIAAAVLAMMGAIVFGSFQHAYKEKTDTEAIDDRYAQVRGALDRMANELAAAYLSEHFDHSRYQQRPTLFKGRDDGNQDELTFTALANERFEPDEKTSDQVVLKYYVDRDPDGKFDSLYRRTNPIIDEDAERRGRKQVLCENVKGLDFKYWDPKENDWVEEWDASKPEHDGVLPDRVKITLTLVDEAGKERKFTTQSQIMLTKSLDF